MSTITFTMHWHEPVVHSHAHFHDALHRPLRAPELIDLERHRSSEVDLTEVRWTRGELVSSAETVLNDLG